MQRLHIQSGLLASLQKLKYLDRPGLHSLMTTWVRFQWPLAAFEWPGDPQLTPGTLEFVSLTKVIKSKPCIQKKSLDHKPERTLHSLFLPTELPR